jgi:hypothetical protein
MIGIVIVTILMIFWLAVILSVLGIIHLAFSWFTRDADTYDHNNLN